MSVRVGIVGTGNMGSVHARTFASMEGMKLVCCYDIITERAEKNQKAHGIDRVARDYDDLLDQVDAVVIAAPDACHAPMTLKALAAGKHVLCEKPLTSTFDEARTVAAAAHAASQKGIVHMVDFSYRRSSAIQEAMRMVRAGELGEIRQVESSYLQSWAATPQVWTPASDWRAPHLLWKLMKCEGSGGVLYDLGCHLLDFTTACSEDLAAIRCELRTYPKFLPDGSEVTEADGKALDANDIAFIELQLKNGGIGIAHTSRWAVGYGNTIHLQVHGTQGALRIDLDRSYDAIDLCLGENRRRQVWDTKQLAPVPGIPERFAKAVLTGVPDQPDLLRGARVQAYLHACELSAESHKWEEIPAWDGK